MSRILSRPAGHALAGLAALLAACSADTFPTQPEAPVGAAPVDVPIASYTANSWATKPDMSTRRRGLVTATVNGVIYAIGGRSASEVNLSTVEAYNPGGLSYIPWLPKASLPAPRAWASGAAVINGKIYVPGGLNGDANPTKSLFMYNPATNVWVKKAAMPVPSYAGGAAAVGGKLYVLTPSGNSTLLHRYDPASNSWTARATGPMGHYYPVVGVVDGKIYAAGTMHANESGSVEVTMYDPATDTWTPKNNMPEAQLGAGGTVISGKLYVVGGFHALNIAPISNVRMYNPATNSWSDKAFMPGSRGFLSAAASNGVLYAAGGLYPPTVLKTTQAYYP